MKTNIYSRRCSIIHDPFSQIPETCVNISHNNANVSAFFNGSFFDTIIVMAILMARDNRLSAAKEVSVKRIFVNTSDAARALSFMWIWVF